ncbi:hypothetical protein LJ739_13995 [Aestuariibacter halophilus]|uniref:Uncharacterized protein n=1 Tax=Fluctibacter halophilus TaxID=226011 RepID=A0ABS8GA95_9ALTE|nr:hypothetical protein [Aestuariibacter halophilus]MCC2617359.1 hypothetical protein [Aestuariibacter halophilus]
MKGYILVALILCLLVSEALIWLLLSVFVAGHGLLPSVDALSNAHTLQTYVFSLGFRVVPYVCGMAFSTYVQKHIPSRAFHSVTATWLVGVTVFIGASYWMAQRTLFTGQHTSSTYALDFIIAPFVAIPVVIACGVIGYPGYWLYQRISLTQ